MPPDEIDNNEPESRRDTLMAHLDAAEAGTLATPEPATFDATTGDEVSAARARDESGRFAPKAADAPTQQAAPVQPVVAPAAAEPVPTLTTWRKEYLPIQQKLAAGQALTPDEAQKLANYNIQREKEYSTGVSTYKAEAQQAAQFTQAMAEFMPTLQQNNLNPAQWIQNLGRAHHTLAMGSPEQKLQMFTRLAQDYGVPLAAVQQAQGGQVDPLSLQLMQELQNVNTQVKGITSWREQQEQQAIQQELSKFSDTARYPHFEQVRESMAQLLERGIAQNPDEAYAKAVRLDDGLFTAEQSRQAAATVATTAASRQAAVAKARTANVSVRSATPSGATASGAAKDRRGLLSEALDAADSGRV
jgi:hypothetical protein